MEMLARNYEALPLKVSRLLLAWFHPLMRTPILGLLPTRLVDLIFELRVSV